MIYYLLNKNYYLQTKRVLFFGCGCRVMKTDGLQISLHNAKNCKFVL